MLPTMPFTAPRFKEQPWASQKALLHPLHPSARHSFTYINPLYTGCHAALDKPRAVKLKGALDLLTVNHPQHCPPLPCTQVVTAALDKPREIKLKGALDLVTATDEASEAAILSVLRQHFPTHAVLGEEGGVSGDPKEGYLWCVDPLDGTTNFAHQFPSFAGGRHAFDKCGRCLRPS